MAKVTLTIQTGNAERTLYNLKDFVLNVNDVWESDAEARADLTNAVLGATVTE